MLDGFHVCSILDPLVDNFFFIELLLLDYFWSIFLIEVLAQEVATLSWP